MEKLKDNLYTMRIHKPSEVLNFWEEIHGEFKPLWKPLFLHHKAMKRILEFQSDQIKVAIRRNKKLDLVLQDLEMQAANQEEFDRKQNPFFDANKGEQLSTQTNLTQHRGTLPRYKKGRVSKKNLRRDAKAPPKIAVCSSCGTPIRIDNLNCRCS
jgi:hypothetical protein